MTKGFVTVGNSICLQPELRKRRVAIALSEFRLLFQLLSETVANNLAVFSKQPVIVDQSPMDKLIACLSKYLPTTNKFRQVERQFSALTGQVNPDTAVLTFSFMARETDFLGQGTDFRYLLVFSIDSDKTIKELQNALR